MFGLLIIAGTGMWQDVIYDVLECADSNRVEEGGGGGGGDTRSFVI